MNLKKIIVNSLAVVGAIVVVDKLIEVATNKGTKIISEDMLDDDFHCEDCTEFHEENEPCACEEDKNDSYPDIEKYENSSEEQTFQYSVKAENIKSEPSEV